ncbi:SixA phosphatase family protein [Zhouia sp. PK063]|uniref:SixA phosphatase family protein n=1 Tax=Zhouia sp. PK063 TaxID=3373602 RepID=UPI0037B97D1F
MKRLTIVRHAKSSWDYQVSDRNRPLLERGISDAQLVASFLSKNQTLFTHAKIFVSTANRALHTCTIFCETMNLAVSEVKITKELYEFSSESVMAFVKSLPDELENVMIFGHNPAFTSVCNTFGNREIDNLPTAGVAVIDFESNTWRNIHKGKTILTIFPKQLK